MQMQMTLFEVIFLQGLFLVFIPQNFLIIILVPAIFFT